MRPSAEWIREHRLASAALAVAILLAFASIIEGVHNALQFSTDFQWSPVSLLVHGENPYQVALSGNVDGKILLSQYPPYLHLLYIVMAPFAFLPYGAAKLVWALINIALGAGSLALLARIFRLAPLQILILAAAFFISTPFRNGLGNGQTSLLCLFAALAWWDWQDRRKIAAAGALSLLLVKYSFAPPIVFWLLATARLRLLAASLLCLAAGWLGFSWICHENPLDTLGQPMKVAALYAESLGGGDIMTLLKSSGLDRPVAGFVHLSWIVGILTSCLWVGALRWRAARLSQAALLAALCLIAMVSIRHLAYDYVFLAPAAALAFSLPRRWGAAMALLVAYFWFGLKLLDLMGVNDGRMEAISFVALNAMLLIALLAPAAPSIDRAKGEPWPA
ncbi:MAG: DUF2029 domain-containing protein [Bradyrhizobium sp.]|nr:MAG: DUF2029 domain-containing protein [Bradyrhizobium sp.]